MIRVCVAGGTGWVGSAVVPAIAAAPDLQLAGVVSRSAAGRTLGSLPPFTSLTGDAAAVVVRGTVDEALDDGIDVLVDYTTPQTVRAHVLAAIARGVRVVIGTSGMDEGDYAAIGEAAQRAGVGVIAGGNFSITGVLLEHFATVAARFMPSWEIIDYSSASKPDAPSGTTRAIAARLAEVAPPVVEIPIGETHGDPTARGATINATQVHSIRLPGYLIGAEVIFGLPDERLTLRYDGGPGAEPYVAGTLLAIRNVGNVTGLSRSLASAIGLR